MLRRPPQTSHPISVLDGLQTRSDWPLQARRRRVCYCRCSRVIGQSGHLEIRRFHTSVAVANVRYPSVLAKGDVLVPRLLSFRLSVSTDLDVAVFPGPGLFGPRKPTSEGIALTNRLLVSLQ